MSDDGSDRQADHETALQSGAAAPDDDAANDTEERYGADESPA